MGGATRVSFYVLRAGLLFQLVIALMLLGICDFDPNYGSNSNTTLKYLTFHL